MWKRALYCTVCLCSGKSSFIQPPLWGYGVTEIRLLLCNSLWIWHLVPVKMNAISMNTWLCLIEDTNWGNLALTESIIHMFYCISFSPQISSANKHFRKSKLKGLKEN